MFISQVTFESEKANEGQLKMIMKKKLGGEAVPGLLGRECWRSEGVDTVGYTLTTRWAAKEDFSDWMKAEHAGGHKRPEGEEPRPAIKKTGRQYELVEPEALS